MDWFPENLFGLATFHVLCKRDENNGPEYQSGDKDSL